MIINIQTELNHYVFSIDNEISSPRLEGLGLWGLISTIWASCLATFMLRELDILFVLIRVGARGGRIAYT